jgi:hypothetical protein
VAAVALTVEIHFDETRADVDHTETWEAVVFPLPKDPADAEFLDVDHDQRDFMEPVGKGSCETPEAALSQSTYFTQLASAVIRHLDRTETIAFERNTKLKLTSRPGESSEEFAIRLRNASSDRSDEAMAKLRSHYEPRFRKARRNYEAAVRSADTAAEAVDAERGDAILGMGLDLLMGRKPSRSSGNRSASKRLGKAEDKVERMRGAYEDLAVDLEDEIRAIEDKWAAVADEVDTLEVGLEADDIRVTDIRVVWIRRS